MYDVTIARYRLGGMRQYPPPNQTNEMAYRDKSKETPTQAHARVGYRLACAAARSRSSCGTAGTAGTEKIQKFDKTDKTRTLLIRGTIVAGGWSLQKKILERFIYFILQM